MLGQNSFNEVRREITEPPEDVTERGAQRARHQPPPGSHIPSALPFFIMATCEIKFTLKTDRCSGPILSPPLKMDFI